MKLHVFNDSHGFFLNLAVSRILESGTAHDHRFINLSDKTIYPNERVNYVKKSIPAFRHYIKELPAIHEVIFYPLDGIAAHFLRLLRMQQPAVQVTWVFWGYEFYHRSDHYADNFDSFSLDLYHRRNNFF